MQSWKRTACQALCGAILFGAAPYAAAVYCSVSFTRALRSSDFLKNAPVTDASGSVRLFSTSTSLGESTLTIHHRGNGVWSSPQICVRAGWPIAFVQYVREVEGGARSSREEHAMLLGFARKRSYAEGLDVDWWPGERAVAAVAPIWGRVSIPLAIGAVTMPALFAAVRLIRDRGRRRSSRCASCGYPLQQEFPVCPECGKATGTT